MGRVNSIEKPSNCRFTGIIRGAYAPVICARQSPLLMVQDSLRPLTADFPGQGIQAKTQTASILCYVAPATLVRLTSTTQLCLNPQRLNQLSNSLTEGKNQTLFILA